MTCDTLLDSTALVKQAEIVISHYVYRGLEYLSVMLRYSGLFGLVCNSPVQGQVVTDELKE
ncbi:uncharacterized protein N7479_005730 [Penicillium vulpinum]|uniref:uncharacterized protein n=1 Tax=Penicillium vulpinum TaxID=29845 RepID=UPI002548B55C|nr:uncharacterized protein N7479_005730 [Penicillium vulpinum]KAJ5958580.1 hypothetical protein N7479_005730 [Penicillium vulpinum]